MRGNRFNTEYSNPVFSPEAAPSTSGKSPSTAEGSKQAAPAALNLAKSLRNAHKNTFVSVLRDGNFADDYSPDLIALLRRAALASGRDVVATSVVMMRRLISLDALRSNTTLRNTFCLGLLRLAQLSATDDALAQSLIAETSGILGELEPDESPEVELLTTCIRLAAINRRGQALSGPDNDPVTLQHGGCWLVLAVKLAAQGLVDDAEQVLQSGLERAKGTLWCSCLWQALARLRGAQQLGDDAQRCLARGVASAWHPDQQAACWAALGSGYLSAGQVDDVDACIQKLEQLAATDSEPAPWLIVLKARKAQHRGLHADAMRQLELALHKQPQFPLYLQEQGMLLADKEGSVYDARLAQARLSSTLGALPVRPEVMLTLAALSCELQAHGDVVTHLSALRQELQHSSIFHWSELPLSVYRSGTGDNIHDDD